MRRPLVLSLTFFAVALLAACGGGGEEAAAPGAGAPGAGPGAETLDPANIPDAGSISGTINFTGTAPDRQTIQMSADPYCLSQHQGETVHTQRVVVNDNDTLRWVFVYVKEGLEGKSFPTPAEPVVLDQEGCLYQPHMMGIQTGQTLQVTNSDQTLHNINVQPQNSGNRGFNIGQPMAGVPPHEWTFSTQEIMVPAKCDVHPWMSAYIGVVPHPYHAVSDESGSFSIDRLPPGDYVIEAWHETLGTQTQNVTVAPNGTAEATFSFGS